MISPALVRPAEAAAVIFQALRAARNDLEHPHGYYDHDEHPAIYRDRDDRRP